MSSRNPHHAFKSLDSIIEIENETDSSNIQTPPERSSVSVSLNTVETPKRSDIMTASVSAISTPRSVTSSRGSLHSLLTAGQLTDPVQGTTDDASVSKLSAIMARYYEDPYCYHIVKHPTRRSPLINRGYYSRVAAIRNAISIFLNSIPTDIPTVQVVNLGAGLDTTYFWVTDFWTRPKAVFYEIDFLEVIAKKIHLFTKKDALWTRVQQIEGCQSISDVELDLRSEKAVTINDTLYMIPVDMRNVALMEQLLASVGFDGSRPTLFISECSLIYLQAQYSDQLIKWAASKTTAPSAFIIYEQIHPHDAFGKTMVKNLELRGCPLLSIHDYPTIPDQTQRFMSCGWDRVTIADMNRIYDHHLDKFELVRIQNLELFDELEEWRLIQNHYIMAVAVKGRRKQESIDENKITNMRGVDLEYLTELSTIWDTAKEQKQDMPRFTTEELRSSFCSSTNTNGQLLTPLLVSSGSHPKLCPGPLSPLMCPEGSSSLVSSPVQSLHPTRKWSLANSPSETDLQRLVSRGRSSFGTLPAAESPREMSQR